MQRVWKTDLFLSTEEHPRYFAATVKSNVSRLEGGRGLRSGIVPEAPSEGGKAGVSYSQGHQLWLVTLVDPNGFMGLFNDAHNAVAGAICTHHSRRGHLSPSCDIGAHTRVLACAIPQEPLLVARLVACLPL
jgi:hypothetical protein